MAMNGALLSVFCEWKKQCKTILELNSCIEIESQRENYLCFALCESELFGFYRMAGMSDSRSQVIFIPLSIRNLMRQR